MVHPFLFAPAHFNFSGNHLSRNYSFVRIPWEVQFGIFPSSSLLELLSLEAHKDLQMATSTVYTSGLIILESSLHLTDPSAPAFSVLSRSPDLPTISPLSA